MEEFINKNEPKIVLNTQYVVVSRNIRNMNRYANVVTGKDLYPNNSILSEYAVDCDIDEFFDSFISQLENHLPFFATLIKGVIDEKFNIVFLCTKQEEKLGYMQAIRFFVESRFHFPIYKYKKNKINKSKYEKYNKKKILKKCDNILKKASKDQIKSMESTIEGRKKLASKMSKKEQIKKLTEMGIIGAKEMNKAERKEYLEEMYIYS